MENGGKRGESQRVEKNVKTRSRDKERGEVEEENHLQKGARAMEGGRGRKEMEGREGEEREERGGEEHEDLSARSSITRPSLDRSTYISASVDVINRAD